MSTFREKIASIIDNRNPEPPFISRIFELFIISLILLNAIAIVLESFAPLYKAYEIYFFYFELVSVIIFTIEYLLRIVIADLSYPTKSYGRSVWKFIISWNGLIDLLAILPFYLPLFLDLRFVRTLRMMRLLRLLKLTRYSKALSLISQVIKETRQELNITIFITIILLFFASTLMYFIENSVQPEAFPNIIATLWWAVATLTTVGYGDVYPITPLGKILSGIIALLGIGIVALPTGIISAAFLNQLSELKELEKQTTEQADKESIVPPLHCPHCGKEISKKTDSA